MIEAKKLITLWKKNPAIDSVGVLGGITTCVSGNAGAVDATASVEVVAVKVSGCNVGMDALDAIFFLEGGNACTADLVVACAGS